MIVVLSPLGTVGEYSPNDCRINIGLRGMTLKMELDLDRGTFEIRSVDGRIIHRVNNIRGPYCWACYSPVAKNDYHDFNRGRGIIITRTGQFV